MYAPNKTYAVFELCFSRGYLLIIIGGGLSGSYQVCDTHLHKGLESDYTNAEMIKLLALAERFPGSLPALEREDCIETLQQLWKDPDRHVKASVGFLHNMISNALDGSQDVYASHHIAQIWQKLGMCTFRAQALAEIDALVREGFEWNARSVYDVIGTYEESGILDSLDDEDEGDPLLEDPGGEFVRVHNASCFAFVACRRRILLRVCCRSA